MKEQTWMDPRCTREGWRSGPWDDDPDKVQWKDEATGLPCLAKRHASSGHWCGYVGVDPSHPWYGKCYSDLPDYGPDVHGGLTFADECQEGPPEQTVCHIPEPGEPEHLWWFGFDCHHAWDLSPQDEVSSEKYGYSLRGGTYKPLQFVKNQCAKLAAQVAAARS